MTICYYERHGRLSGIPPLETGFSALLAKAAPLTPSNPGRWLALAAAFPALGVVPAQTGLPALFPGLCRDTQRAGTGTH